MWEDKNSEGLSMWLKLTTWLAENFHNFDKFFQIFQVKNQRNISNEIYCEKICADFKFF